MSFHRQSTGLEVHVPHSFTYADEAARVAAVSTDFDDPDDLFKIARQTSDMTYWVLEEINPSVVWNAFGAGGGGGSDLPFDAITDPAVDAAVTTAKIDLFSGTVITLTAAGNNQTLGTPTDTTAGRKFFVLNDDVNTEAIAVNGVNVTPGTYVEFRWDGTAWHIAAGGAAGVPGGPVTALQFNTAGAFDGSSRLTWDDTNRQGRMVGSLEQVSGEVGDTYTPTVLSTTSVGANPRNSTVLGSNLYVVDQTGGDLRIYDVTDPAVPVLLGSVTGLGGCRGVDIAGRYVYVSSQSPNELHIVDVQDKSTPVIVSSLTLPAGGSQRGVRVRGTTVFTTNNGGAQGFSSVDVTDPSNPALLDTLALTTGPRTEFDVAGGVAFLSNANSSNNFQLIEVSDPTTMSLLVSLDIGSTQWAAKVQGPYAYVVGETNPSFQIFDVSDPAATTNVPVGSLDLTPTSPRALDVSGDFAYVVDASGNVAQVIDISDPTSPVLLGSVTIGANPVSISTVGVLGYITDNTDDNFKVLDFGGIRAQNLNTGNADIGDLNVRRDVKAAGLINAAGAILGAEGIVSDGPAIAEGRRLGGASQNFVEIFSESDFPQSGGKIKPAPGVTYQIMQPLTLTLEIEHPTTVSGFDPAVIRTAAKYANIVTVNIAAGSLLDTVAGAGQLVLQNIRFESDGVVPFAIVSGSSQNALLTELDDCDVVGFLPGTVFTTCIFNANNASFVSGSGIFKLQDCESSLIDFFHANFVDSNGPAIEIESLPASAVASLLNVRNSKLSSQANESIFMLHSNLSVASRVALDGIEKSPFTPGTGDFFASLSGSITALTDSGGAPGVRTVVISAGHKVADGDTVTHIGFTSAPALNGIFVASNVTASQYEVVAVFTVTDTGTWQNFSLDQKDPKVRAISNPGEPDSRVIGSVFVKGNATATVIVTQSVFADLDLGTALAGSNIERWALTDTATGELRYDGIEPFAGILFAHISGTTASGSPEYRFRVVKNGAVQPDDIETVLETSSGTTSSTGLVAPVSVVNGDLIRLQVVNVDGTQDITVSHCSISIQ